MSGRRKLPIEPYPVTGKAISSAVSPTHIPTVVERHSRFVMLVKVPGKETVPVVKAFSELCAFALFAAIDFFIRLPARRCDVRHPPLDTRRS